jgi:serine/threonine protein kinase/uncharacterized protein YjiK
MTMLQPGTLVQNRYLIEQLIGQGGMGAIYRAIDQRFGAPVALKQKLVSDEETDRAFEREAKLLNGLRHSALPRVIDYFADESGHFLVMEFIPGEDLHHMITTGSRLFSVDEVLQWADQLLDALEYLHGQHPPVIHRDIKPQNLKLAANGQIILLDFGIAKGGSAMQTRSLEGQSVKFYTPEYAPIEQIQGSGTDQRSDLYSLAATLYHLLTTAPPEDALSRTSEVAFGNPDPQRPAHEINPQVPPAISNVLLQAMAIQTGERFSSAAEMRTALQQAKGQPPAQQQPQGPDFHSAPTVQVPGMRPAARPAPGLSPSQAAPPVRQSPAPLSPSEQRPAGPQRGEITPASPSLPVQMPKNRWMLPFVSGIIAVVALIMLSMAIMGKGDGVAGINTTQTPTASTTATTPSPSPSPEATEAPQPAPTVPPAAPTVAVAPPGAISIVTVHQIGEISRWEGMWDSINSVVFSPDGQTLAAATDEDLVRVWRVSDNTPLLALEGHEDDVNDAVFAPDGRTLVSASDDETLRVWETSTGGHIRTLKGHEGDVTCVTFSRDGLLYASGSRDNTVRIWRASDGATLDVLNIGDDVMSVAFSPDGTTLAIGANDNKVRLWRVGSGPGFQVLDGHKNDVMSVAFSPDGQLLASGAADSDNTVKIWRVSDGSLVRTLRGHSDSVFGVAFSPDGQMLASAANDETVILWLVGDGSNLRVIGGFGDDVTSVAFSPDGKLIAAGSDDRTIRVFGVR